jgi:dimethylglycine dehydrogenase
VLDADAHRLVEIAGALHRSAGFVPLVHARVVIIGGGVVGVSALYHLAKAGWTDCILLEKNELTAGSTWHAAGNVPTFSTSWSIMNMQRYSTELYRDLGERSTTQ